MGMYRVVIKRGFDIILSLIGLLILCIPMLVIAISIRLDSPGPALFRQKRFGIHKSFFTILKFRTMVADAPKDVPTHLLTNQEQYSTPWQRKIRRSSLDELPQLFCILIGKMSFVGPRPALWNQEDLMAERDKYTYRNHVTVNDIKPGLTGYAQIHGRDTLNIEEKAKLDGEYLSRLSFKTDLICFFETIKSVIKKEGVA